MKRCPQCGDEYDDKARFCRRDGQRLDTPESNSATPATKLSPEADKSDPMIGRVLAGRYRLLEKLGQGGMGAVYKGQHVKMNRLTAIKILTTELASNPEFVARFEREAEMASHINHPNAVAIYDFGEAEDGLVYLAMEFLDGQPLSAIIKREGPLPLERVVYITRQAAEALDAAHQLEIIHRDFKPDNVMICRKSGRPDWVEVVDFGIAKQTRVDPGKESLTQTGFVLGTPQYMSPEQVSGEPLDRRSDLYSLALVTYEMLTGALPFEGSNPQSQMVKRLVEPPLPLRRVRPQLALPPTVEPVIMKALARYPKDRYSSTVEFATELEAAARAGTSYQPMPTQHQPIPAPPIVGQGQAPGQMGQGPFAPRQPTPAPPAQRADTPARPTPPAVPVVQPPFQPSSAPMPIPTPVQPQMPYYHMPMPQPVRRKSNAGPIILAIVIVFLLLMGGCFVLALIGSMADQSQNSGSQSQIATGTQRTGTGSVQEYIARSRAAREASDLATAEQEARAALNTYPNSPAAHIELAEVLWEQERFDEAEGHVNTALKLDPQFAPAHQTLGVIYIKRGDIQRGIEEQKLALQLNPEPEYITYAHSVLGQMYSSQGRLEDALKEFQAALSFSPRPSLEVTPRIGIADIYSAQNRLADALAELEAIVNSNIARPNDLAWVNIRIAGILQRSKNNGKAIDHYLKALDTAQKDDARAESHLGLASIYIDQNRYDQAMEMARKGAELAKDNNQQMASAYFLIGLIHYQQKRFGEAVDAFARAKKLNPQDKNIDQWLQSARRVL